MPPRVLFGRRGSDLGIWVSKPGYDVRSAGAENLLLSSDAGMVQAIASGTIYGPGAATTISFPDMGFQPWVILASERWQPTYSYLSNAAISIARGAQNQIVGQWNVGSPPNIPDEIRYVVLNLQRP